MQRVVGTWGLRTQPLKAPALACSLTTAVFMFSRRVSILKKNKTFNCFKLLGEMHLLVQNGEWSYFHITFPAFVNTEQGLHHRPVYSRSHLQT